MHSSKEIAKQIGVDTSTVNKWCKKLGVARFGRSYAITDEDVVKLKTKIQGVPGNPQMRNGQASEVGKKGGKPTHKKYKKQNSKEDLQNGN